MKAVKGSVVGREYRLVQKLAYALLSIISTMNFFLYLTMEHLLSDIAQLPLFL